MILKGAFDAYKAAAQNKTGNKETLLDALMNIFKSAALLELRDSKETTKEADIDYSVPNTFVNVMGDVLMANCDRTLASMNLKEKVKYGWRIKGDKEDRALGVKDIIPFIKGVIKGED